MVFLCDTMLFLNDVYGHVIFVDCTWHGVLLLNNTVMICKFYINVLL